VEELVSICTRYQVRLLLSLHDWEAPFIASHLDQFRAVGTIPIVSSPDVIDLCLDKLKTQDFASRNGIAYPFTVSSPEEACDAFLFGDFKASVCVKPRFGQGSIGIQSSRDEADITTIHRLLMKQLKSIDSNQLLTVAGRNSLIFQEFIEGEEFGLDVVNDLNGKFVVCFVKRKFSMRAGKTDVAETINDPLLESIGKQIGSALGHIGILDVDLTVRDGVPYLLEMNPRFGGHYPFSHMAGANIPAAIVAWALGVEPDPSWLRVRPGVKCFKDITLVVDNKARDKEVAKYINGQC
jgi:carbamoyl-phosphate synthase large subunit